MASKIKKELTAEALKHGLSLVHGFLHSVDQWLQGFAKTNPTLVGLLDDIEDDIEIGPITLVYAGFYSRVGDLVDALNKLSGTTIEFRRSVIINLIRVARTNVGVDQRRRGVH